jgi:hypothetical protein
MEQSTITCTLLSGAVVELRPLTLADQQALAVAAKQRAPAALAAAITKLLTRCTVRVADPGVYPAAAPFPWATALAGDRLDALLQLRAGSYADGNQLLLEVRCAMCDQTFGHAVDLVHDLYYQPYPANALEAVRTGCPLEGCIANCRVRFFPLRADSEIRALTLGAHFPGRDLAAGLCVRLEEVLPPEGRPLTQGETMDWLDGGAGGTPPWPGLSAAAAEELRALLDAADGGIDTTVAVRHEVCGGITEVDLPFAAILIPAREVTQRRLRRAQSRC